MPALLAVHETAPDDPSIPLQQAHPQPQDPLPQGPPSSQTKRKATQSAKPAESSGKQATTSPENRVGIDSAQQDELTPNSGSAIAADVAASDGGNSSSSSSSDAVQLSGWGFKIARPPGYRNTVAQTPDGKQAGLGAAEAVGAREQEWPYLWYPPEDLIGRKRDTESADEQGLVAEQILHQQQQQQQESGETEAASQDVPVTSTASSGTQTASRTKDLESASTRQIAGQDLQQPAAVSSAGTQDSAASGYLPQLDLLAQFGQGDSISEDLASHALDDAKAAKGTDPALCTSPAESAPAGCNQDPADSDEGESRMMVNLNGAQVLTPDGWESVSSKIPLGTAWEQGNCLTIGMTLQYHMSATSGHITAVTCGWATLDAFAWTIQDMMDLYIRCTGLHRW